MLRRLRLWRIVVSTGVLAVAGAQLVPYGRGHDNPPAACEPRWDSLATRALVKRACFDCHSNETEWPAYARVAPVSWMIQHDVDEGRSVLNFSEWHRPQEEAAEGPTAVIEKEMPPRIYQAMHAQARLTSDERAQLARGLAMLPDSACAGGAE